MSDHRNHRHRASEPAWPTGEDSNPSASGKEDRTGFWSPLWEDDDDDQAARPSNGHGRRSAPSNGHARSDSNGRNGSGGHARPQGDGGGHRWPEAEPPAAARHAEGPPAHGRRPEPPAPPRPSGRRGAAPVWPSAEEAPAPGRRPGGPPTPPPPGAPGRPPAGPTQRVARPRPAGPPRPGGPGRPGVDPDGPTEMLPPQQRGVGPEPELLTHRELDYDEDLNDDPDLYDDEEEAPLSDLDRKRRRKKVWKRVRRTAYVLTALGIISPIVAFFVAYQMVEVPNAAAVASTQGQVVTLKYADNTEMTRIVPPGGNRTMVRYDQLPDTVKHAVFAAEDAEFMTNPGFDISGVMRAGWNQVTGGAGGGSTITQQYIKKATGNDEASGLSGYSRKFTEVVKAYKMNNTYSKEKILESYLNTIYFGRGANGIVAAGRAYFGKELKDLKPNEAALLAGMIQLPGKYDDMAYMQRRWAFVMDQMVQKGWLSASERQASQFPQLAADQRPTALEGPRAHIQSAVLKEVKANTGMDLDMLQQKGYTIETTIDPVAQGMAEKAVDDVMAGQNPNILPAMVAIDPKTGEVRAYWGGRDGNGIDWAQRPQEPGSSFKPFDLVALLEDGKGLGETYDGTSGRQFVDNGPKIRNSGGASCGKDCTVAEAMKRSINTVFYDIALNTVGTQHVANAAKEAGIKSPLGGANGGPPDANISIGGGNTQVTTYEMASAYATFAANGIYRTPHLVKRILTPDGGVFWQPEQKTLDGSPAFDKDSSSNNAKIARNVTESLLPIPDFSKIGCSDKKRQCAGKTGTHQYGETEDNAKAWMVGYTPQISVAVSMGAEENKRQMPLKNSAGKIIYGSGLPGLIWQKFMNTYLKNLPVEKFTKFTPIGKAVEKSDDDKDKGGKPSGGQQNSQSNNQPPPGNGNGDNGPPSQPSEPTDTTEPGGPETCIPPLCNDGPGGNNNNGGRPGDN